MPNSITVGYEGLQQAANQLRSGKQELTTILRDLQAVINGLTSSGFKTRVASGRFGQHYRQWNDATGTLVTSLDDIARAIQDAQQKHEQADQTLAAGVGAIGGTAATGAAARAASGRGGAGGGGGPPVRGGGGGGGGGSPGGSGGRRSGTEKPHPPGLPRNHDQRRERRWADPARRTDTRPYGPGGGRAVAPSRRPSPDHRPTGTRAPESTEGTRAVARQQNRANISENKTADVSAGYGFRTRQKPPVPRDHPSVRAGRVDPKKDPDYEIEGRFFDGKWIRKGTPLRTVRSRIDESINSRQSEGVILDMTDSKITRDELVDFLRRDYPPDMPLRAEVWYRKGDEMFPIWP